MVDKKKAIYVIVVVCISAATLTFRPGLWLTHKPASTQSTYYVKGWEDGCISGTNSWSLLYAPLLEKPFVKEIEFPAAPGEKASATAGKSTAGLDKDHYRSGWNEGFTFCRYYQSSVYELMQFAIVVATLLFIGYLLARKKQ
ncbi:MAG: hypothetical protein SFT92_07490 [Rickettsiales bacterium]|nr:hypothetical protein [Rickettsiales bacterium]